MGATTQSQKTRNEILDEFHQRCDVTQKAYEDGLLDFEEKVVMMDRYRIECEEAVAQVNLDEAERKKRHKKILLGHEKEVDQFLKELLTAPPYVPPVPVAEDEEEDVEEETE